MKWNWGYSLTLLFIAFATHIGYLVYRCTQEKYDLVSSDYYNEELHYQDKIDGSANAKYISTVKLTEDNTGINIQMPQEMKAGITGKVLFYCPANAANDRTVPLHTNKDGVMKVEKKELADVRYIAKVSWTEHNRQFYYEQPIVVKK